MTVSENDEVVLGQMCQKVFGLPNFSQVGCDLYMEFIFLQIEEKTKPWN